MFDTVAIAALAHNSVYLNRNVAYDELTVQRGVLGTARHSENITCRGVTGTARHGACSHSFVYISKT
jgi:hypothetical protein